MLLYVCICMYVVWEIIRWFIYFGATARKPQIVYRPVAGVNRFQPFPVRPAPAPAPERTGGTGR